MLGRAYTSKSVGGGGGWFFVLGFGGLCGGLTNQREKK